jgi:hypothetical protein
MPPESLEYFRNNQVDLDYNHSTLWKRTYLENASDVLLVMTLNERSLDCPIDV